MGKKMILTYDADSAVISDIKEVNSSFATGKLKIMYHGFNRNGSHISKQTVLDAIPSIYNIPIVANYDRYTNGVGGHDVEFAPDSNGDWHEVNLTEPCGVVTDHTKVYFEVGTDPNGVEREYLVADGVVLWKRCQVYRHLVVDLGGRIGHSMEIEVEDGHIDKGTDYYDITKFEFQALCLLGGHVEPCFEGSELTVYSNASLKDQIAQMMGELKRDYSLIVSATNNADANNTTMEGGCADMNEKDELLKEYGIEKTDLDFSVDDVTLEELKNRLEQMRNPVQNDERGTADSTNDTGSEESADTDQASADADSQANDAEATTDEQTESDNTTDATGDANTDTVDYAALYAKAQEEIASLNATITELTEFKKNAEKAAADVEKDAVFARFADLDDAEMFISLKEKRDEYSAEQLEEKCFAIRGRLAATNENKSQKFSVNYSESNDDEPYGGIVKKYAD